MRALRTIRLLSVLLILSTSGAGVASTMPVVYEDDNILVRAGIVEAGTITVHIGDALTLSVDVLFDPNRVRVESLDDDLFQRAFAATPQIRQYQSAAARTEQREDGSVRIVGEWQFQVLDCPQQIGNCPGPNTYQLPVIALSYQLADADGRFSSDLRSVRFQPWPGSIDVAAAIAVAPAADSTVFDVLPGGAYPAALTIDEPSSGSALTILLGAILFATGLVLLQRVPAPQYATPQLAAPSSRWEHALYRLYDQSLTDDQWSDMCRRSFAWYCTDQLQINPYSWLGIAAGDRASVNGPEAPLREFFIDILSHAGIGADRRPRYRERLLSLTGHAGYANKSDSAP